MVCSSPRAMRMPQVIVPISIRNSRTLCAAFGLWISMDAPALPWRSLTAGSERSAICPDPAGAVAPAGGRGHIRNRSAGRAPGRIGRRIPDQERRMRHSLALLVLTVAALVLGRPAMAIEQPRYVVAAQEGDYEIRRYAPYVVAEVTVEGDQGTAVQAGFRKLAGYIFGGNAGGAKIAMTAPVAQQPVGESIPMTRPVTQTPDGQGRWTVQFMMPSGYTLQTLPRPNDPAIHFRGTPAREMAVVRFSGVAREASFRRQSDALRHWAAARGLALRGAATLAQYDPPWTLWFLRRNEVLIEAAAPAAP